MLDNKTNVELYFDTSKSLKLYEELINKINALKKELLDSKKILDDFDNSLHSLLTIKRNLKKISDLKHELNGNYDDTKEELNQEFYYIKGYNFQEKFELSMPELNLRVKTILNELNNFVSGLTTPLKEEFESRMASFNYKEKVEIVTLIDLIEKMNQTLSNLGQDSKDIESNILELLNICLTIQSIIDNQLYADNLLMIENEHQILIKEFMEIQTNLNNEYTSTDSLLNETASDNYKKAEEIRKALDNGINSMAISNNPTLPIEYQSSYEFIFATRTLEENKDNSISFPELGLAKPISLDVKDIFKIPLGTDALSNVIIKTNSNIKDDKDFIRGLDTLFYRYLITFPGLSKQVCAMHRQINSPLTVIHEISRSVSRCVLSITENKPLIESDDSIKKTLEYIGSIVTDRNAALRISQKSYKNIYEYNVENTDNIQNPIFLLIKDFPNGFDADSLEYLSSIFSDSQNLGIFIVLIDCIDHLNKDNDNISETRKKLYSKAGYIFKHIGGSLLKRNDEILDLKFIKDDFKFFDFSKSLTNVKAEADKPISLESINPEWESIIDNPSFSISLDIPIGKEDGNVKCIHLNIGKSPHILVSGQTGSGKTVFLHTLILSAAMNYSPDELQIILIDFKDGVEFSQYSNAFPHVRYLALKSTPEDAVDILNYLSEYKTRINNKFKTLNCNDIGTYNSKAKEAGLPIVPRTLIVIDEYHNAIMNEDFLFKLKQLVKEIRSAGMSLVLSDQVIPTFGFNEIYEQIGTIVAFPSNDMSSIDQECEKRKNELYTLKGLCFIKADNKISKVRVAYTRNDMQILINKIRSKYVNYPIQAKNISYYEKSYINDNNSIPFSSTSIQIEKVGRLSIRVNLGMYRMTRNVVTYGINNNNKLLVVLGDFEYAQHIFLSIIREYINFDKKLNLSKETGNVFIVDLNENIETKRKNTLISILRKKCGNLNTHLQFYDGTDEFTNLLQSLDKLYNDRMNDSSLELYPIQVLVSNADKMSIDEEILLNLLKKGDNVGIYFAFQFKDVEILRQSCFLETIEFIKNFKDSIIVPNKTNDNGNYNDTYDDDSDNTYDISTYVDLYNGVPDKVKAELKDNLSSQSLEDIYALINDDGRINKIIMNQYSEVWLDSLLEEAVKNDN